MFLCKLCPIHCGVDRDTNKGPCHAGVLPRVARADLHFWEEPCISGKQGSGAVFFSGCNMHCIFCQNFELQDGTAGHEVTASELADTFLMLQEKGAANINLVTPTPHLRTIRPALEQAKKNGLHLPVVYNTSGYESIEGLHMMDGLVDIYLPDLKYVSEKPAAFLSNTPNYFTYAAPAILEMYRQVGLIEIGPDELAKRGLIIRHLVLPGCLNETRGVLDFIAEHLPHNVSISLMRQYAPTSDALPKPFNRKITDREYDTAIDYCLSLGLENVMLQKKGSATLDYTPSFTNS